MGTFGYFNTAHNGRKDVVMNKTNKEHVNNQIANNKEVSSSDLICEKKKDVKFPENINDDLIIGAYVKHNNKRFDVYIRLDKERQNCGKFFENIGVHAFLPASITSIVRNRKIIPGNPYSVNHT